MCGGAKVVHYQIRVDNQVSAYNNSIPGVARPLMYTEHHLQTRIAYLFKAAK